MNGDVSAVQSLLRAHDPADQLSVPPCHRTELLERILQEPQQKRKALRRESYGWRPLVAVSALGALVVTMAVIVQLAPLGRGPTVAHAATPRQMHYEPVSGTAASTLRGIARRLLTSPSSRTAGSGHYQYIKTQSWSLFTRVDGRQVRSAVVPEVREVWRAGDGSGRMRRTSGTPEFPSQQSRDAWQAAGRPALATEDVTYPAGGLAAMYPQLLPEGYEGLREQLSVSHPVQNGPAETLVAVSDLYNEQSPNAATRAAILEVLAATPGLQLQGRTVDRVGRTGVAVGLDSTMTGLPTRFSLVFDEVDGKLLDQEQVLTTTAGRLDVPIPSVIQYTTYVAGGFVDTVSETVAP